MLISLPLVGHTIGFVRDVIDEVHRRPVIVELHGLHVVRHFLVLYK